MVHPGCCRKDGHEKASGPAWMKAAMLLCQKSDFRNYGILVDDKVFEVLVNFLFTVH
jgi:hypothetical protein